MGESATCDGFADHEIHFFNSSAGRNARLHFPGRDDCFCFGGPGPACVARVPGRAGAGSQGVRGAVRVDPRVALGGDGVRLRRGRQTRPGVHGRHASEADRDGRTEGTGDLRVLAVFRGDLGGQGSVLGRAAGSGRGAAGADRSHPGSLQARADKRFGWVAQDVGPARFRRRALRRARHGAFGRMRDHRRAAGGPGAEGGDRLAQRPGAGVPDARGNRGGAGDGLGARARWA